VSTGSTGEGPKRHGREPFEALCSELGSAMEAAVGSEVWVRGAGLNAEGAENRARDILGPGWRSAVATGKILRKNRKGQVQVKLDGGPTVWVAAEFVRYRGPGSRR